MDVLVFAGGDAVDARWHDELSGDAYVIAADSGLEQVHALGRRADLVVGDFDSVSAAALERARAEGSLIEEHPADKDATDLELALARRATRRRDPRHRRGRGWRSSGPLPRQRAPARRAGVVGLRAAGVRRLTRRVVVVRRVAELTGPVGSLVSLLAPAGIARGVRTAGLRWPLAGGRAAARLDPGREQRDDRDHRHRDPDRRRPARHPTARSAHAGPRHPRRPLTCGTVRSPPSS